MTFKFPAGVLAQHTAVLGKTGSGKTSTAKLMIEQVVADGSRVCILDPIKSDWWGLTSSKDGKRAGLPFVILGGPYGHAPLHSSAGKAIGDVVASGSLPLSIIDMADFEAGGLQRFFVDFAETIFKRNRGVLYLVVEEAHEFAPKERSGIGAENMSIHWAKKLATGTRTKGIRLIVATQRTQALHNAMIGSCDTVIAHRMTAPADQEPVIKWMKANAGKEAASQVADTLSNIRTGSGWLASGEAKLFELVEFPRIQTYDNTATPTGNAAAEQVKTAPVDAEKLRSIIGDAVKSAEANDPAKLKARIAELERQAKTPAAVPDGLQPHDYYLSGFNDGRNRGWKDCAELARPHLGIIRESALKVSDQANSVIEAIMSTPKFRDEPPTKVPHAQAPKQSYTPVKTPVITGAKLPHSNGAGGVQLPRAERAILTVLAQYPEGRSRVQLAILSRYSVKSSSFQYAVGALRTAGYASKGGEPLRITDEGRAALGSWEPLPVGEELIGHWLGTLPKAERALLEACVRQYPKGFSKEELAETAAYSVNSSSFQSALGKLRSLELVDRGAEIRASKELFG